MADVLLHIPHASALIPPDERARFSLAESDLDRELLKVTDWFTDDLFCLDRSERLVFGVSRLLVDPERFADDESEVMSKRGLGAVYTSTHDGKPLKSAEERDALLAQYYQPHHQALNVWAARALQAHGRCLIIDCHSFPSTPLPCDLDQEPERPDFCIGSVQEHTPERLVAAAIEAIEKLTRKGKSAEYSVLVNRPYEGSILPSEYFGRDTRVCSIMIEVRRGLYMDEQSGERSADYDVLKSDLATVIKSIAQTWSDDAVAVEIWEHADSELMIQPVKLAFEAAAIGTLVAALGEMGGEESWRVPVALFLTAAAHEAHPSIRQLIEHLRESAAVPMYTSNWVVETVQKKLRPYEIASSSGSRTVGAGEYSVHVKSYFVPSCGVMCLEYLGGDEIEVHGVKLGSLTKAAAAAWIAKNQPDAGED